MWGKDFGIFYTVESRRITPTRVGKRDRIKETDLKKWDHPHACGEKQNFAKGGFISGKIESALSTLHYSALDDFVSEQQKNTA